MNKHLKTMKFCQRNWRKSKWLSKLTIKFYKNSTKRKQSSNNMTKILIK